MKARILGHTTWPVPAVGLGCMSISGFYGPASETQAMHTLGQAVELGVTLWDTANIYGNGLSERLIGKYLAENRSHRDRLRLCSKFGIGQAPDGRRLIDNSPAHLTACLDGSLSRLGVDHIDLYYVHRLATDIPVEDTMGELARHVAAGKIGAIGLSEVAPDTLRRAHAVHPVAAVQSEYSLWTRSPELGLIQACAETGTSFVAFSPVGRGYFCAGPLDPAALPASDFRHANPRFTGVNWQRNKVMREKYLAQAADWGVDPSTLAIAWVLAKAPHVIAIPGTRSARHLAADAAGADLDLTADQVGALEALLPVGFAAGERYTLAQWMNVERYG